MRAASSSAASTLMGTSASAAAFRLIWASDTASMHRSTRICAIDKCSDKLSAVCWD